MSRTEISKLFELSLKVLRKNRIPLYSGKFSRKDYTQHQHLALLVLKTFLNADYRKTCSIAEDLRAALEILDLPKVPHFTTLQKFFARINNLWLETLLCRVLHHFASIKYLAIDSTGLSADRVSSYYVARIKGEGYHTSNFLKLSLLFDVKRRLPVAICCHNRPRGDNRDFKPLLKKISKHVKYFVADKAYDSEANFAALKCRQIEPIIPLRLGNWGMSGKLRKQMLEKWATHPAIERQYHQRSLIESFFSALKRRLGSEVRSRLWHLQRREAAFKVIVYSILRQVQLALFLSISTEPANNQYFYSIPPQLPCWSICQLLARYSQGPRYFGSATSCSLITYLTCCHSASPKLRKS